MSQPPSPYGGPPGPPGPPYGGPPYGGPPGPYPPQQQPGQPNGQPSGMSNKAKFWIGVALALPVVLLGSIISGGPRPSSTASAGTPTPLAAVAFVVGLGELAALVAAIVLARTRWFAIGVIAGVAVLFVLAAGACVVLIVGLTSSYN